VGEWFIKPLGSDDPWRFIAPPSGRKPVEPGRFVCDRCGMPLVPCDRCGGPAMCGDAWCELCQPE
jgi:hypothetical protein